MKKRLPEEPRAAWFRPAACGLFVHWGVSSVLGRGEWVMRQENIPVDQYAQFAARFNPKRYDPHAWAALAREAGMKYMVLTARHHDGYSLFDSRVSTFTSARTAARRDLVAEFAAACRKAGLRVGFYYSLDDWRFPCRGPTDRAAWRDLVAYVHAQVEELMTRYGRKEMGRWLQVNGEAIYGVQGSGFNTGTAGCAAVRGRTLHLFVHWWPGSVLTLPAVDFAVKSARILGCRRKIVLERQGGRLLLKNLPEKAPDPLTTVIALERHL